MASGKPQNLLVPLIVSVVITVATSVTAFLFYQKATKLDTELKNAAEAKTKADNARNTAEANLKILKDKIGYPEAEFGSMQDAVGGTSLMSMIALELSQYANAEPGSPSTAPSFNFKDELKRLDQKYRDKVAELTTRTDAYKTLQADFGRKETDTVAKINEHDQKMQEAEKTREGIQTEMDRNLAESTRQIQIRQDQVQQAAMERTQFQNDLDKLKKKSDGEIGALGKAVKEYKEGLSKLQSAGTPVGAVVSVDNLNNEVYIDKGEDDLLPLQTTLSIWAVNKRGTLHWREKNEKVKGDAKKELEVSEKRNVLETRLEGGPKAYIEIVAILGPHAAKGRITMEKTLDPITPGDLLFSPIWKPGQQTHFALVGRFDMTGKDTDDRTLLINLIKRQWGVIDAEVKNDGTIDGKVEVGTHYLVIGTMPGELAGEAEGDAENEGNQKERENAAKIWKAKAELESAAKTLGVEIIDQHKLYDFMGYKPHSNKYTPGGYTGGPEPKSRFDNPSQSTQPKGLPSFESGASSQPTSIPGTSVNIGRKKQ
jgi:hypothetical protein